MEKMWLNEKNILINYFNEKIFFLMNVFSYSWHKIFLCHGIKYPIFPPSKMPINYLYAMPIKVFLLFMPGIYTKDLGYPIFLNIFGV
jgi:hypothetical protein